MELNSTIILKQYPSVILIEEQNIIGSPFANCQTFTISNCRAFNRNTFQYIHYFFKKVQENLMLTGYSPKRLFIMDVTENELAQIKYRLAPFIETIQEMPYVSTNSSKMVICLVRLNQSIIDMEVKETDEEYLSLIKN